MYKICYLFILFFAYSLIGYICEVICCSIYNKRIIVNRGFLMGPYLPIYGVCCLLVNLCLSKYYDDLVVLFVMSVILCSLVEFFTSFILEKIFKVRWWDYSTRKFNLDGRVCLFNSCLFGLGGVILIHGINRVLFHLEDVPEIVIIIIGIILMVIFITDLVLSIITLSKIKITTNMYDDHDATKEIKKLVEKQIVEDSFLMSRLLNAFPKLSGVNVVIMTAIRERINSIRKRKRRFDDKCR